MIHALALIFGGAYFFFDHILSTHTKGGAVGVASGAFAALFGLYWLWIDFIKADPTPEE